MMPVPTHLRECVVPHDSAVDEQPLVGKVRCPCGCETFNLLYAGQAIKEGNVICSAEIDGKWFFIVKARCTACAKEHVLFNEHLHGYCGFVTHDEQPPSLPNPPIADWNCPSCGGPDHKAVVEVHPLAKEDYAEIAQDAPDELPEERWPDAFEWFNVHLECCGCGHTQEKWVDFEAA